MNTGFSRPRENRSYRYWRALSFIIALTLLIWAPLTIFISLGFFF